MDDLTYRKERDLARKLRTSGWWQRKVASGTCEYCLKEVGAKSLTMDHIVPLSDGGRSVKSNLAACCKSCNNEKRDEPWMVWQEKLAAHHHVGD